MKLYDRKSLRVATFCAEPVSPSIQQLGMDLLTPRYINSYWATEHGGIVLTHFHGNDDFALRPDAHTFPLPWVFADVWIPEATHDDVATASGDADAARAPPCRARGKGQSSFIRAPVPVPRAHGVGRRRARVGEPSWRGVLGRFSVIYFARWSVAGSEVRMFTWSYTQGVYECRYDYGGMTLHGRSERRHQRRGTGSGTEEIEGAILKDKQGNPEEVAPVGNAIVVGAPHREKGTVPLAFILYVAGGRPLSLDDERSPTSGARARGEGRRGGAGRLPLRLAVPRDEERQKYMRRFLKNLLEGELRRWATTTTLRNPEALEEVAGADPALAGARRARGRSAAPQRSTRRCASRCTR